MKLVSTHLKKIRLREPFSSSTHLLAAFAGIFGAIYLLNSTNGSYLSITAVIVYSSALITLFLISGLFHGLVCSSATLDKLERLDYAAIYFFIASTYTPVCLVVIRGWLGAGLLVGEWILAVLGIYFALKRGPSSRNIQVCIFLLMGWSFLLALPALLNTLSDLAFNLLLLGGLFYSVGAIIFAFDAPRIFKTCFSAHDFWHILVILGSISHYIFILQVIS